MVGTVRCRSQDVSSLQVIVLGRCRLDPRWHNVNDYKNVYGRHPHLLDLVEEPRDVCFWATKPVELLDVPERPFGSWEQVKPKPMYLDSSNREDLPKIPDLRLPEDLLAYTFRVDLPDRIPPSLAAVSCRYYYTVAVRIVRAGKPYWIQRLFEVWNAPTGQDTDARSNTRVSFGTLQAMAHAKGLPGPITSLQIYRFSPETIMAQRLRRSSVQSLRVKAPGATTPLAEVQVVGASTASPGSRVHLQFALPEDGHVCRRICACLRGQEEVLHRDGSVTRARTYLWTSDYKEITATTTTTSLALLVPLDAPWTIASDLVRIFAQCTVEMTVEADGSYQSLRLEFPCSIAPAWTAEEGDEDEDEVDEFKVEGFDTRGIARDLEVLSLRMADQCGLIPGMFRDEWERATTDNTS